MTNVLEKLLIVGGVLGPFFIIALAVKTLFPQLKQIHGQITKRSSKKVTKKRN